MKNHQKRKKNREYIDYYINGYINSYNIYLHHLKCEKKEYKQHKIEAVIAYLGIPSQFRWIVRLIAPISLPIEFIGSIFIISFKLFVAIVQTIITKKRISQNEVIILALSIPSFRMENMLRCLPNKELLQSVSIPFVKNVGLKSKYSIYSGLKCKDTIQAFSLSICLIYELLSKYGHNDWMFRAYNAYEYFLTCIYVEHSDSTNRFVYTSTIDRWAYLMGNDTGHRNIFIQHGILFGPSQFIKYKGPHTAYYINDQQRQFFEREIFNEKPSEVDFRPCLQFTANDKLLSNGKPNLLLVCCEKYLDLEKKYLKIVAETDKYNIYVKPHPGTKNYEEYINLCKKYNSVLLKREDYPHVDFVLSYESTLAYEYEDVGILVLKYDDNNFEEKLHSLIND